MPGHQHDNREDQRALAKSLTGDQDSGGRAGQGGMTEAEVDGDGHYDDQDEGGDD